MDLRSCEQVCGEVRRLSEGLNVTVINQLMVMFQEVRPRFTSCFAVLSMRREDLIFIKMSYIDADFLWMIMKNFSFASLGEFLGGDIFLTFKEKIFC